jgi:predicted DNA-binding transcriptional regulator AlpA
MSREFPRLPREIFMNELHETAVAVAPQPVPALLNGVQAARYVGLSKTGWHRAKSVVGFPKPVRVSGSGLRWRKADLDEWVAEMRPARL